MTDQSAFPPLAVGTDPAAVRRLFQPMLVLIVVFCMLATIGAVVVAALMGSTGGFGLGVLSAVSLLICSGFLFFLSIRTAVTMTARAAAGEVLRLDEVGMRWNTPQGQLEVPWEAVAAVSVIGSRRRRIAVYRLDPAVTPTSPGVRTDIRPDLLARAAKLGMRLGAVGLDQPLDTVLAATAAFTRGRLTAR